MHRAIRTELFTAIQNLALIALIEIHLTPPPFLNRHSKTCRDGLESEGLVWIWNIGDDMIISIENICIFHFK
jgi:hypothetical protein